MTLRQLNHAIALLFVIGSIASPAIAGPNQDARLVIALTPAGLGAPCRTPTRVAPESLQVSGALAPIRYFASVLVTRADAAVGVAGAQFGIRYESSIGQGVDILEWTSCASTSEPGPGWPGSGSGITLRWSDSDCRRGMAPDVEPSSMSMLGYFYCTAYGFDSLSVIPHPADRAAVVTSCAGERDTVESPGRYWMPGHLGAATFSPGGSIPGFNPTLLTSRSFEDEAITGNFQLAAMTDEQVATIWTAPFPLFLQLADNHWVLVDNQCYRPGSRMKVWYDEERRSLMADDGLWQRFDEQKRSRGVDEVMREALFDRAVLKIQAAFRAIADDPIRAGAAELDSAGYDPSRCIIQGGQLRLRTRDSQLGVNVAWPSAEGTRESRLVLPEKRARLEASRMLRLERPARKPELVIHNQMLFSSGSSPETDNTIRALEGACSTSAARHDRFTSWAPGARRHTRSGNDSLICMPCLEPPGASDH